MLRSFHRWPGLVAAAFLILLALTGAILSVFPAWDAATAPKAFADQTVAQLAGLVLAETPGVEQIKRAPSGQIVAYWFEGDTPFSAVIDPASGKAAASADPNPVERWVTELHRSLFMGDSGRIFAASAALAMAALAISGAMLVARRMGGWSRWFQTLRGPLAGRLHTELARIAVPALGLTALTALWMTAATFDLLPDDAADPAFPAEVSGQTGAPPADMPVLMATPLNSLRELTFPYPGDATDVFTLKTDLGTGLIDQGTGEMLVWASPGPWAQAEEWVYLLHTGQGAAIWGLVLGLLTLAVPVMAITGVALWWAGLRGRPRLTGMAKAAKADVVILIGSEGGSTWGFGLTLARALHAADVTVHIAPMQAFTDGAYPAAKCIIALAATWGDGAAPSSAKGFLDRIDALKTPPKAPLAVLGFGDRSFPAFCAYADKVVSRATAKGWTQLLPIDRIDRQSPQDFARWGKALGQVIGLDLLLDHQPDAPQSTGLTLISRRDYGEAVQAPAAILRFALPRSGFWQRLTGAGFAGMRAGDLLGIVPDGATLPRFYSLASGAADGFVEIAVRKHPGGVCSGQLMALQPGQSVQAFVRPNPGFRADHRGTPLILIGAGTGIGPLVGFIRANNRKRPIHLWFGARDPQSDLLYGQDLAFWAKDGRLTRLNAAFSRTAKRQYVQDRLRDDAANLQALLARGAKIMVCGGRDMAQGVQAALSDVLSPMGLTPTVLKAEGRYVEDVY